MPIERVCRFCSAPFLGRPNQVRSGTRALYCSKSCAAAAKGWRPGGRDYVIQGDGALVPLGRDVFSKIDASDVSIALTYPSWHLNSQGYAHGSMMRDGIRRYVKLHRLILGLGEGVEAGVVDHINGDRLDNRRSNLRVCTLAENAWNSKLSKNNKTGFKGVYFCRTHGVYKATIRKHQRVYSLGTYDNPIEAAQAYNAAAASLFGQFARLNSLDALAAEPKGEGT